MAGTNPAFNASKVRDALRTAMGIGAPSNPDDQITFRWTPSKTAMGPADPAGIPYDLHSRAASTSSLPDVKVPAGARLTASAPVDTQIGEFDPTKLVLTVLDEDYAQIQGADKVLYCGNTYDIEFAYAEGLFDMTSWTIICRTPTPGAHKIVGS